MTSTSSVPSTDPAVVLVFVDHDGDASAVSGEDLAEWLAILGDVASLKLQYDVASKTNCFSVAFKQARTAQQAVQHLDGQKLKGCTIRIFSKTYKRVETAAESEQNPNQDAKTVVCVQLPHNHHVPRDVRMDAELVPLLPQLETGDPPYVGAGALWEQLKTSQARLAGLMDDIETVARELLSAEATSGQRTASHTAEEEGRQVAPDTTCFRVTTPIPFHKVSPTRLVALCSEAFGPLSVPVFVPFLGEAGGFALTLQFWRTEDAALFWKCMAPSTEAPALKRPRHDYDGGSASDVDSELLAIVREAQFVRAPTPVAKILPDMLRVGGHALSQLVEESKKALSE